MATNATHGFRGNGSSTTTECKEDALNGIQFERFFEQTYMMESDGLRRRFAAIVLGRLGLRRGELCHLQPNWVNFHDKMISIPRNYDCTDGKGGRQCGLCRQQARQQANEHDDRVFEEVIETYWRPKSEAAIREVYFGWDRRVEMVIRQFMDRYDGWMWSGTTINRDINEITARTDLSEERVYPHSLRATAATNLAVQGMNIYQLMQFFGWKKFSTAEKYISRNAMLTAKQMSAQQMGFS